MLDPKIQELMNYPNTKGKRIAMETFNWDKLTKVEEAMNAKSILELAKRIDEK